jgi:6-pyruvoyltetrahydropterin/6-carboxytetrahydropterin synthase
MTEHYHVRVAGDDLAFSSAHFITLDGGTCERLHGHNFRVAAEVYGTLDENQYVVDLVALHDLVKAAIRELDHRVLLPTGHPSIRVVAGDREVEARHGDRRWVFPRDDCALVPVANTTAELLARYLGQCLVEGLRTRTSCRPTAVTVEVDECPGQSAACELRDLVVR